MKSEEGTRVNRSAINSDGIIERQTVIRNKARLPEFSPFRRIWWRNFAYAKPKKTSPRYLLRWFGFVRGVQGARAGSAPHHRAKCKKRAARTLFLHLVHHLKSKLNRCVQFRLFVLSTPL